MIIDEQVRAIVWAQWRSLVNARAQGSKLPVLTAVLVIVWYGAWCAISYVLARFLAQTTNVWFAQVGAPAGLFGLFLYWQVVPLAFVSGGLSLDLSRLSIYPIRRSGLFLIDSVLRLSVCFELVLVSVGIFCGIALNRTLPWWAALALLPYVAFNLLLSIGMRDLITRALSKRGLREALILLLVLISALPQLLLTSTSARATGGSFFFAGQPLVSTWTPWGAVASLLFGHLSLTASIVISVWLGSAWFFAQRQYRISLRTDRDGGSVTKVGTRRSLTEWLARLPSRFLPDPLGFLMEKELLVLSRSARFRVLFLMGFTFGFMVWLPLLLGPDADSGLNRNYLTAVSVYALMLLGEICFFNIFGLDRAAAQNYFVLPVRLSQVLLAKNIAACFVILLEVSMVTLASLAMRMPLTLSQIAEAFAVTAVAMLLILSAGNWLSVRSPRPIDPSQAWRTNTPGRAQSYLLIIYPLAAGPILLAFGARYAFDSLAAFYGILLLDVVFGLLLYWMTLDSAATKADQSREAIMEALASGSGPVGS